MAWLIPGLGHYYIGEKWKGVLLFFLLLSGYITGMIMSGFCTMFPLKEFGYFIISMAIGIISIIITLFNFIFFPSPIYYIYGHYSGCLYICVTSLLNLLIIINLYKKLDQ